MTTKIKRSAATSKKFIVTMVVEGCMMDKDTPISEDALSAYFELKYQCPKGLKVNGVAVTEMKHE